FVFFFSSRRRHTRSYGDWSSDVCSSDLCLAKTNTKKCPNCNVHITKDGGCFHMTCELLFLAAWLGILLTDHVIPGQCRHEFCWECLTSYAEIRQNGRESHKDGCYFRTSVT